MSDDDHFLSEFLRVRLVELGLEYDTYGPYVTGLASEDNDGEGEENDWDDVLELLKASSELDEGEMEEAFAVFRQELQEKIQKQKEAVAEREESKKHQKQQEEQERLQKDILLAEQAAAAAAATEQEEATKQSAEEDAAKQALVARYAYDESETYDADGNLVAPAAGSSASQTTEHESNRDVASRMAAQHNKEVRGKFNTSKKEEREKTKKQREDKAKLKEQRRNRATKGERRR